MKNKCLFVIDLDGTLLPNTKKIPFFTIKYLNQINKQGYRVVLASGRPARNVKKFHTDIKLDTPIIALNGLHIHYPKHTSKDRRIFLPPEKVKMITKLVSKHFKIKNIICETDKEIYITNKDAYLDPNFWLTNMQVVYGTLNNNLKHKVMTFLIEMEDRNFNQKKLLKLFKGTGYYARCWIDDYQGYVEIFDENSNKARAIKQVAREMNIPLKKVFAFGDDMNDIEMLRDLPNSYAMKNSRKGLFKYAKHITKYDNEHEGVRKEIETILKTIK